MHLVGNLGEQLTLERAVGQQAPQHTRIAGHVGAAFGGQHVAGFAGGFEHEAAQWHGLLDHGGKALGAVLAYVAVRVMLGWQKQKLDAAHIAGKGQGGFQRLAGGAAAGAVAVKAENHRVGEAEQLLHMLGSAGGAQRGHGIGKAQLGQRHHVHIAFGHQGVAVLAQCAARFKQAVEFAALAEHRGLRRVQVLGFVVAQHAPAKADALALDIADGEHHAVAKAVVAFGFAGGVFLAGLAADDQAAFHQQRVVVVCKDAGQAAPALGRIAQTEGPGDLARQSATLEVVNRPRRVFQVFDVGDAGFFEHAGQRGLLLAHLRGAGTVLRADVVLGHLQTVLLRQVFDGLNECHAGMLHQEADGVAVFAATEAVVKLFGRADRKGR